MIRNGRVKKGQETKQEAVRARDKKHNKKEKRERENTKPVQCTTQQTIADCPKQIQAWSISMPSYLFTPAMLGVEAQDAMSMHRYPFDRSGIPSVREPLVAAV